MGSVHSEGFLRSGVRAQPVWGKGKKKMPWCCDAGQVIAGDMVMSTLPNPDYLVGERSGMQCEDSFLTSRTLR